MVLADSVTARHIVQIFDKDRQHVITTILAIPNYRLQPTGDTVFQFWEVPAGQPRALRAWFYPGDNFGQEFAYPKQTAAQIAAYVKTPVPAIEVETSAVEDLKTAPLVVVDETGRTAEWAQTMPARAPDAALQPVLEAPPLQVERAVEAETPALAQTFAAYRQRHAAARLGRVPVIGRVCRPWISLQAPAPVQGLKIGTCDLPWSCLKQATARGALPCEETFLFSGWRSLCGHSPRRSPRLMYPSKHSSSA